MKKIKQIREDKGLSQSQLATAAGVNVHMIQKYEQGAKDINKAAAFTVYRIARALDCAVEDLLEDEE